MEAFWQVLEDYGYWVLLVGTFLEGETILLVAGYMASLGTLHLPLVIATAFLGTFCGDQFYFLIGRRWGKKLMSKWSKDWRRRADRVFHLLHKYDAWFILSFRFFYGIRNVTPFAIGMTNIEHFRFFWLNALAAIIWAIIFANLGYLFGKAIEPFMDKAKEYQLVVLGVLVGVALTIWLVNKLREKRKE